MTRRGTLEPTNGSQRLRVTVLMNDDDPVASLYAHFMAEPGSDNRLSSHSDTN